MCGNCMSSAEVAFAQAALIGYAIKGPVHRALARAGLVAEPDPVAHDVRTVAFLLSLELDPTEILGAEVVAAARAWSPAPRPQRARRAFSAAPIGSQSMLTAQ
jgi:hypothetical protein